MIKTIVIASMRKPVTYADSALPPEELNNSQDNSEDTETNNTFDVAFKTAAQA